MTNFIKESAIFLFFDKTGRKISEKWNESAAGWYFTRNLNDIKTKNSFFGKILNTFLNKSFSLNIGGKFGDKLKSSVLLNAFSHYEIGVFLMLFVAPIVPTMLCVLLALLTFLSFFVHSLVKNDMNIKIDSYVFTAILLLLVFFIYSATSYSSLQSLKIYAIYFVFICFMFMVVACGSDKKNFGKMVFIFVLSGFFVSIYGIYQQFFGNNLGHAWLDEDMFEGISIRVYSTLGNPNVLGEYLLLLIPVCGTLVYASDRWFKKLFYFAVLGSSSLCMIFTQSRGCWLGLILVAVVFALLLDKKLVFLGILVAIFIPSFLPESIIQRFMSIGNMGDSSTSYRVYIWLGTLRLLRDYWWNGIGIGQGAFNKVYPYYSYNAIIAPHSHNLYLQLTTETGIFGLLTFISVMLVSMKKMLIGYIVGKKNIYGYLCGAVIAGLLGFLLQGMFDYVWYNYRVFLIFWMVIGLGVASRRCACEENYTRNQ